jgi:hypothetical protein
MNTQSFTHAQEAQERPPVSLRVVFLIAAIVAVAAMQSPLALLAARVMS